MGSDGIVTGMPQPLALVFYERLLPGQPLINRLRDLDYRVGTVDAPGNILAAAARERPMLVFLELGARAAEVCAVIRKLRASGDTAHIPVFVWPGHLEKPLREHAVHQAQIAGASVLNPGPRMIEQLPELIAQSLDFT